MAFDLRPDHLVRVQLRRQNYGAHGDKKNRRNFPRRLIADSIFSENLCPVAATTGICLLLRRYQVEGASGLAHRLCGRVFNRKLDAATTQQVQQLIGSHYCDFGPVLAYETLAALPRACSLFMVNH